MLCGSRKCNCAFVASGTITVTGSGAGDDPFILSGVPYDPPVATLHVTSGTWNKPAGLAYIIAEAQGAGGGSGGCIATGASQASIGGAGGGGGYARKLIPASSLAATETIVVGTGGTAGAAGNNLGGAGGASSFGTFITANGGGAGSGGAVQATPAPAAGNAGAGGTATGGDINIPGSQGSQQDVFPGRMRRSKGGASHLAGEADDNTNTTGTIGSVGKLYGGGASGGFNAQSQATDRAGAAGADGCVIITEYFV